MLSLVEKPNYLIMKIKITNFLVLLGLMLTGVLPSAAWTIYYSPQGHALTDASLYLYKADTKENNADWPGWSLQLRDNNIFSCSKVDGEDNVYRIYSTDAPLKGGAFTNIIFSRTIGDARVQSAEPAFKDGYIYTWDGNSTSGLNQEVYSGAVYTLVGNFNDWDLDDETYRLNYENGKFVFRGAISHTENLQFKVVRDHKEWCLGYADNKINHNAGADLSVTKGSNSNIVLSRTGFDQVEISMNVDDSSLYINVPKELYIFGNPTGDWNVEKPVKMGADGIYSYTYIYKGDSYFRFRYNGKYYVASTDGALVLGKDNAYNNPAQGPSNGLAFRVGATGMRQVTIYFEPSADGSVISRLYSETGPARNENLPADVAYAELNVMPRLVRLAGGNWNAWKADEPIVYIKANYLNNNVLVPDWEMIRNSDGTYSLNEVTLRGAQNHQTYGSDANPELTAVVIYKNQSEPREFKLIPDGLETASGLQYGRVYNLTLDLSTGLRAEPIRNAAGDIDRAPKFFSMNGYNFQQRDNEDTPNVYTGSLIPGQANTGKGWQEAWILYDENGNPQRDLDGKYIYSTQWPPKNTIFFNAVKGDENMEMMSSNLVFRRHDSKSGQMWMDELRNSDNGSAYANLNLEANTTYARYVIPRMWVLGATKIWTGWGGQISGAGNAQWSNNINWGIENLKGNEEGTPVNPQTTVGLEPDKGNFMFDKPTYFQTVELFFPIIDGDSEYNAARTGTKFYTTLAFGDATIKARTKDNAHEQLIVDFQDLTSDARITSYEIVRYNAATSNTASDNYEADWNRVGYLGNPEGYVVASKTAEEGGDLRSEIDTEDYIQYQELRNGRYIYLLRATITDNNGEHRVVVASNPITIANYNFTPSLEAIQLMQLTKEAREILGVAEEYDYLTYRPEGTGKYFAVNSATSETVSVDSHIANQIIDTPELYFWTSNYYIKAFDTSLAYASNMQAAALRGEIEDDYTKTPKVMITHTDAKTDKGESAEAVESVASTNGMIGHVFMIDGNLASRSFSAEMSFSYTPTNEGVTQNKVSSATVNSHPEIAKPYNIRYTYYVRRTDRPDEIPSSVVFDKAGSEVEGVDGDDITLAIDDFTVKELTCRFSFRRPNVSDAILDNYQIRYTTRITNTAGETLEDETVYVDKQTATGNDDYTQGDYKYFMYVSKLSPKAEVNPIFEITATDFRYNTDDRRVLHATYDYDELRCVGTHRPGKYAPSIEGIRMGKHLDDNGTTWSYQYKGHYHMEDDGDPIHMPDAADKQYEAPDDVTDAEANVDMQAKYYQIETYVPGAVRRNSDGTYANYYAVPRLFEHKPNHISASPEPGVEVDCYDDPLFNEWIGIGFENGDDYPVVQITSLYVFYRDVVTVTEGEKLMPLNPETRAAVRSRASEEEQPVENHPKLILYRGGTTEITTDENTFHGQTTGIEDIAADGSDVEYFNVQGMRVANPVKGEVYIVRQGAKASKVRF